jgi:formate hydrogenlyase subunit 4
MTSADPASWLHPLLALLLAPLLPGVINRVKAIAAGRRGPPLLQPWFDLVKLLRKGAVYSTTTTPVFWIGPMAGLAALVVALFLVPMGGCAAAIAFHGDLVLFAALLAIVRMAAILAALDTGSPFEGMGASREAMFAALAEPALFLGLAAIARRTESFSLSGLIHASSPSLWLQIGPGMALVSAAIFAVFLAENARIPVDDPNTHLELTMIHEVMVLDHGGPDFAFILYGAALKLWLLGAILVGIVFPVRTGSAWVDLFAGVIAMFALAAAVGAIGSMIARLRMSRVPQMLVGAVSLSTLALILVIR